MFGVRRLCGYFRRAAARRAIHRMLYWDSRYVMKIMPRIPMLTQRIVRLASSPADSGGEPDLFSWMM
jgi:hypothetical protein